MDRLKEVYAEPKFSVKCNEHRLELKFTNKSNPYYQCKKCLVIIFPK